MRSLLCLDVSENKIERLPEQLGNLLSLADLLVSQNLVEALPESIGRHSTFALTSFASFGFQRMLIFQLGHTPFLQWLIWCVHLVFVFFYRLQEN